MKLDLLKPIVRSKAQELINKCAQQGITLLVTSTFRSFEEQNALYAQGRTKPGSIVTNAKGGESLHNYGVAFDVVQTVNGVPNWNCDWNRIGLIGESCGLEWGGHWSSFPDKPHFQYLAGYTLPDFQKGTVDVSKFEDRGVLLAQIDSLRVILLGLLARLKK